MKTSSRSGAGWTRRLLAFAMAVVIAVTWGALVQTQFNISALQGIGAEIPFSLRLQISASDLLGFSPLYSIIVVSALIIALPCAAMIAHWLPRLRAGLFALAGGVAIALAIRLVDAATPPPTLIAATRDIAGWLLMALGGSLGGIWFALQTRNR
jgi:glucan phosphoethanolaminetransferase (alkaline phosphatase superfamily)